MRHHIGSEQLAVRLSNAHSHTHTERSFRKNDDGDKTENSGSKKRVLLKSMAELQ